MSEGDLVEKLRAHVDEDWLCPNCVTPWKCNGPHEFPDLPPDWDKRLEGLVGALRQCKGMVCACREDHCPRREVIDAALSRWEEA